LPIGLADFETNKVRLQIPANVASARTFWFQAHALPEVRIEMDVFNAPDISALVDVDPDAQRTSENIPDQMQLVPARARVDALKRVRHRDVQNLAKFAVNTHRPWIRRDALESLLWIMNGHIAQNTVWFQRNQRRTIRVA